MWCRVCAGVGGTWVARRRASRARCAGTRTACCSSARTHVRPPPPPHGRPGCLGDVQDMRYSRSDERLPGVVVVVLGPLQLAGWLAGWSHARVMVVLRRTRVCGFGCCRLPVLGARGVRAVERVRGGRRRVGRGRAALPALLARLQGQSVSQQRWRRQGASCCRRPWPCSLVSSLLSLLLLLFKLWLLLLLQSCCAIVCSCGCFAALMVVLLSQRLLRSYWWYWLLKCGVLVCRSPFHGLSSSSSLWSCGLWFYRVVVSVLVCRVGGSSRGGVVVLVVKLPGWWSLLCHRVGLVSCLLSCSSPRRWRVL